MFKKSINPTIEELSRSYKDRAYVLSDLKAIILPDKSRKCIWCLTTLQGKQRKWCSEICGNNAMAWGYPQSEHGLQVLLVRQDFKCNSCTFDYRPFVDKAILRVNRYHKTADTNKITQQFYPIVFKLVKNYSPKDRKPEVDHIQPIYKGGQSIGLENHQCICYTCHKAKTKLDLRKVENEVLPKIDLVEKTYDHAYPCRKCGTPYDVENYDCQCWNHE